MKTQSLLLAALVCASLSAHTPDEALFLTPFLQMQEIANKVASCDLESHCRELSQALQEGERFVMAAPASFDVLFTDGSCTDEEGCAQIQQALAEVNGADEASVRTALSSLEAVTRASFVCREGKLMLVTNARAQLQWGESVWRKEWDQVTQVAYHPEEEYLIAFRKAGLFCEEIKRPCFFGNVKYKQFCSSLEKGCRGLGSSYIENNPFTIYTLVKQPA